MLDVEQAEHKNMRVIEKNIGKIRRANFRANSNNNLQQFGNGEEVFKSLRQAEHLAAVEIRLYENQDSRTPLCVWEERRRVWKRGLIEILKNSPSKERKFLRWTVTSTSGPFGYRERISKSGELEVYPGTSL